MSSKCSFFKCLFNKLFNNKNKQSNARDIIEEIIQEDNQSSLQSIDTDEKEMIGNVLDLRNTQVQDIMIPQVSIISVSTNTKIENIINKLVENKLNTILVYQTSSDCKAIQTSSGHVVMQNDTDNIIGVLYLKDIVSYFISNTNKFKARSDTNQFEERSNTNKLGSRSDTNSIHNQFNIGLFIKEVLFIPPTMKTLDLLFQMKQTGTKIAVVIDEYGDVLGMVSFIDLIEEIIGDIKDINEIQKKKKKIIINQDNSILTDGQSTFYEIEKYGNLKIMQNDNFSDTIGGMIISMLGRIPVKGELISYPKQSLEFEIVDADTRRIKCVRICKVTK